MAEKPLKTKPNEGLDAEKATVNKVGKFTDGDHMVHIFLQTGRKFVAEDPTATTVAVQIEVQVGSIKQYFDCKNDVAVDSDKPVQWNEHLFFTLPALDQNTANETDITIRALNKGYFRNELLGEYSTKMSDVYFKDEHKLEHIWMGLSNPDSEDFTKVKGLLKASFSVQGPNDEQPKLEAKIGPAGEDTIYMNAQLKRTFKELKLTILEAHDLPLFSDLIDQARNFTFSKSVEPQFFWTYGGGKQQHSEVAPSSQGSIARIDQTLFIPVVEPVITDRLLLEIKDINVATSNMIGSIVFSIKHLLNDQAKNKSKFYWKDIVGAPVDAEQHNGVAQNMNLHPEIGNTWKGKVLVHIEFQDTEKPKKGVEPSKPEIRKQMEEEKHDVFEEYELMFDIGQGVGMPDDYKYAIEVVVRGKSQQTEVAQYTLENYCYWNHRIEFPSIKLLTACESINLCRMPNVYIYLLKGNRRIAYKKVKMNKYLDPEAIWEWRQFDECPCLAEIEDDTKTGMFNFKLSVVKKQDKRLEEYDSWKNKQRNTYDTKKIRCYIFQCRGLPPADADGVSDPLVQILSHSSADVVTDVVDDNLNPIFLSCKTIDYHLRDKNNLEDAPPIILNVYDVDDGFITDSWDHLGRAVIFFQDASVNKDANKVPEPRWHPIRMGTRPTDPACGEVLISFSVFDDNPYIKKDSEIDVGAFVRQKPYQVAINVLGLRNLKSDGLLPVQKAFIKMKVKSMLPPGIEGFEDKVVAVKESGENPNFNSTIEFKIDLPIDKLYCPVLTCTVHDQLFIGFMQPIVGNFVIPIGPLKEKQQKERECFKAHGQKILINLKKILDGQVLAENLDPICLDQIHIEEEVKQELSKSWFKPKSAILNSAPAVVLSSGKPSIDKKLDQVVEKQPVDQGRDELQQDGPEAEVDEAKEKLKRKEAKKAKFLQDIADKKEQIKKQREQLAAAVDSNDFLTEDDNILFPSYTHDKVLNAERLDDLEDNIKLVFKQIGFNSPEIIEKIAKLQKKMDAATDDLDLKSCLYGKIVKVTSMHYRRLFNDELENNKKIFPEQPFSNIPIIMGQSRGNKEGGVLSKMFTKQALTKDGQITTVREVGSFKGVVNVFNKEEMDEHIKFEKDLIKEVKDLLEQIYQTFSPPEQLELKPKLDFKLKNMATAEDRREMNERFQAMSCNFRGLIPFLQGIYTEKMVTEQLKRQTQAQVHIYMIEAYDLASRDFGSESDPYFTVKCGTFTYSNRDRYKIDCSCPKFGEHVTFPATFPGVKPVVIECHDYDDLFGDDLIGTTIIDLDDRYFTQTWQALEEKPLEQRQLYHPSTALSQGVVEMWLDIVPESMVNKASGKVWNVAAIPEKEFEVRVSVFGIKDLPEADIEGTSDAYVRAFIDDDVVQETDTHYRCTTGNPNFNYRLMFNVKTPFETDQVLSLQAWDRDLLKSNDLLCEWSLNLNELIEDSIITDKLICLEQNYYNKSLKSRMVNEDDTELPFKFVKSPDVGVKGYVVALTTYALDDKEKKTPITIELDIRVLPKTKAETNPVGAARSEPNTDPVLPEPKGRFQLSLNPFSMLNQMCGAKMRCKIYCVVICLLCIVLGIYFMPFIASVISILATMAK